MKRGNQEKDSRQKDDSPVLRKSGPGRHLHRNAKHRSKSKHRRMEALRQKSYREMVELRLSILVMPINIRRCNKI